MQNRQFSFNGTHKEIGQLVGEQYKKWGKKEVYVAKYANDYLPTQKNIYKKYYPEFLDYLEGVAEGLQIPKDKVITSYLTGFLPIASTAPAQKCTAFVVNYKSNILIGRNYDWRESSEKISSLINFQFTDNSSNHINGIATMGTWKFNTQISPHQYVINLEEAWNESLYVCLNGTPGDTDETGMLCAHMVQLVAEKCKTTDDAIKLIQKIPTNKSKLFTIADNTGHFGVVEYSLEKGIHIRESNDYIVTTNHYINPKLSSQNLDLFKAIPWHSTFGRYEYSKLNAENINGSADIDTIIEIMIKPPVLQNWRGPQNGDTITVWTLALNLSSGRYKVIFAPNLAKSDVIQNN